MDITWNHRLHSPLRSAAAALLLVIAATHIPLIPQHLEQAPYVGVLFIALSVASVVFAVLLVVADTALVWGVSGVMTLLALIAFLASRTVGLPGIGDEVGNWTDPLGFPALAAEALATVATVVVLRRSSTPRTSSLGKGI